MNKKRLIIIWLSALSLLLIPLIAMQFTNEVKWTLMDFVVAGILLLITGSLIVVVLRNVKKVRIRIALIAVIFVIVLLIWAELAVGIFGTPISGN